MLPRSRHETLPEKHSLQLTLPKLSSDELKFREPLQQLSKLLVPDEKPRQTHTMVFKLMIHGKTQPRTLGSVWDQSDARMLSFNRKPQQPGTITRADGVHALKRRVLVLGMRDLVRLREQRCKLFAPEALRP